MHVPEQREPEVNKLFRLARKVRASSLYLAVGTPPRMQISGVTRATNHRPLSEQDLERLLLPLLYEEQQRRLDQGEDVAFTYSFEEGDVYRVSTSKKSGQLKLTAHLVKVI